jgi:splicing factor 3A subunit 1
MQQENMELINPLFLGAPNTAAGPNAAVVISTALDPNMKVVKNYTSSEDNTQKKAAGTQKCPKCHQEIPIGEWKEHMRLELMDPKWLEEKRKREERQKLNSLAGGDEIVQNLKKIAAQRTDLFTTGLPPTEQQKPIIWDGQAEKITRTTANIAMLQNQNQRNLQEVL